MAKIDPGNAVETESCETFWNDTLINLKVLLVELQKAYLDLQTGKIQSYQLDTGQSNQRVTRQNIAEINTAMSRLMSQIRDLELSLGLCAPGAVVATPGW